VPLKLFISYSHADQGLLDQLHKHLAQLRRDGTISEWYDRNIHAGGNLDREIAAALEGADIFLACASPDYIASNYCYERELDRALEKEEARELTIVPVIFEPCEWLKTPLERFKAVPRDGKPIVEYTNQNVALLEVATEIRRLAGVQASTAQSGTTDVPREEAPSQSRYRIKKEFDELDKRDFVERCFNEIYRFFEGSVSELSGLPDIEARLSPLGPDSFTCTVINRGLRRGFETMHIRRGGTWGAIDYLFGEENSRNTSNGGFRLEADDYQLHLRSASFGSPLRPSGRETLTCTEAAQEMWDELLRKVGIDYA
jgi:hypothetical protein